ncbi:DNA repair exonuclease [Halobacillus sp. Marseille-Q1614]|uniref:metallophosphoesterase family protein n=1 Tax=Halobacillus sp. Marseille-Q1614 TaxID=2709134 RepID=UPI001570054D|nr:DNA repair exonuclease [Halobacillus sp. Marseille-Q1614]
MSSLRFIHSADLHLDSPFKSKSHLPKELLAKLRASTFEAFDRLIQQTINHHVDFLVVAGDLFNEETRSLKAQVQLRDGFNRLKHYGIQVFISYGNHDYMKGAHYPLSFPDNVHIFDEQDVTVLPFYRGEEHIANLYGFSYVEKSVTENKTSQYKKTGNPAFHIGTLHGSVEGADEHESYAPFKIHELQNALMDYWALGHIHKRQFLADNPYIVYPGNIQGRSIKEPGEKGCYLVEAEGTNFKLSFLPLHSFTYESAVQECGAIQHPEQLEEILIKAKQQVSKKAPAILTVTLKAEQGQLTKWQSEGLVGQWVDILNEEEEFDQPWIWIDKVLVEDKVTWDEQELKESPHFAGEFLRHLDEMGEDGFHDYLSPLYRQRRASKAIDPLTESDRKEIMEAAKVLVLQQLLKGEKK